MLDKAVADEVLTVISKTLQELLLLEEVTPLKKKNARLKSEISPTNLSLHRTTALLEKERKH